MPTRSNQAGRSATEQDRAEDHATAYPVANQEGFAHLPSPLLGQPADLLLILDTEGIIRHTGGSVGRVLGHTHLALRGIHLATLTHPDDQILLGNFLALPHQAADSAVAEIRLWYHQAEWRLFALTSIDLRDEPSVRGFVVSVHDVTARRQAARRSAAFLALGQQLGAATTAEAAARIIARVSDDLLRWDAYILSLYSRGDDLLTTVLSVDVINGQRVEVPEGSGVAEPPGPLSRRVMAGEGILLLRHGTPEDIGELEPFGDTERLSASLMYVPIRADETVVGILSIQSYTEDAYTDADVTLLQALADHCGGALERVRAEAALRASETRLRYQASHDSLTGLPNRAYFQERLALALDEPQRAGNVVAVLFIDLDRFKIVNDSLGHEAGDALLVTAASRLRAALRPRDLAARLGGDEFTILLEGIEGVDHAAKVAARIISLFAEAFTIGQHQVVVSASVGIAVGMAGHIQSTELLRRADIALYSAKNGGRARCAIFDTTMSDAAIERLELEAALRQAIAHEALQLHYQPLTNLETGEIIGLEALVRWPRSASDPIGPDKFIPLAEETGLILSLGRWVLREACRQARDWRTNGPYPDLKISVNLSAAEFAQAGLAETIAQILHETGLEASALELEITEGVIMADAATTITTLRELKQLGVRLAIDDFGTGYSSLSYLKRFPVDTLKIDKAFVDGMGSDPEDEAIVRAMIGVGQALGLQLVAEGIETAIQVARLRQFGCFIGQGHHFAPAGLPTMVEELFALAATGTLPQ